MGIFYRLLGNLGGLFVLCMFVRACVGICAGEKETDSLPIDISEKGRGEVAERRGKGKPGYHVFYEM